jgi:hypothetical protein
VPDEHAFRRVEFRKTEIATHLRSRCDVFWLNNRTDIFDASLFLISFLMTRRREWQRVYAATEETLQEAIDWTIGPLARTRVWLKGLSFHRE